VYKYVFLLIFNVVTSLRVAMSAVCPLCAREQVRILMQNQLIELLYRALRHGTRGPRETGRSMGARRELCHPRFIFGRTNVTAASLFCAARSESAIPPVILRIRFQSMATQKTCLVADFHTRPVYCAMPDRAKLSEQACPPGCDAV
jgi:hypothetical protein